MTSSHLRMLMMVSWMLQELKKELITLKLIKLIYQPINVSWKKPYVIRLKQLRKKKRMQILKDKPKDLLWSRRPLHSLVLRRCRERSILTCLYQNGKNSTMEARIHLTGTNCWTNSLTKKYKSFAEVMSPSTFVSSDGAPSSSLLFQQLISVFYICI